MKFDESFVRGLGRHVSNIQEWFFDNLVQRLEQLYFQQIDVQRYVQTFAEANRRVEHYFNARLTSSSRHTLNHIFYGRLLQTFHHEYVILFVDQMEAGYYVEIRPGLFFSLFL